MSIAHHPQTQLSFDFGQDEEKIAALNKGDVVCDATFFCAEETARAPTATVINLAEYRSVGIQENIDSLYENIFNSIRHIWDDRSVK